MRAAITRCGRPTWKMRQSNSANWEKLYPAWHKRSRTATAVCGIREMHHRIKNNLQIVMSLLNLQATRLDDPAAQDALKQAQVRMNALALVHRILHELEDQSLVDLQRLLSGLIEQLESALGGEHRHIEVKCDIASRRAPSEIAVPLTLFTVEAVTNAFKHAFPAGQEGVIRVTLRPVDDAKLELMVSDDGVGFAGHGAHKGIGSRLIAAFAQQLDGKATTVAAADGGIRVALVFPDPDRKPDGGEITGQAH